VSMYLQQGVGSLEVCVQGPSAFVRPVRRACGIQQAVQFQSGCSAATTSIAAACTSATFTASATTATVKYTDNVTCASMLTRGMRHESLVPACALRYKVPPTSPFPHPSRLPLQCSNKNGGRCCCRGAARVTTPRSGSQGPRGTAGSSRERGSLGSAGAAGAAGSGGAPGRPMDLDSRLPTACGQPPRHRGGRWRRCDVQQRGRHSPTPQRLLHLATEGHAGRGAGREQLRGPGTGSALSSRFPFAMTAAEPGARAGGVPACPPVRLSLSACVPALFRCARVHACVCVRAGEGGCVALLVWVRCTSPAAGYGPGCTARGGAHEPSGRHR
jgi:hypothetical protein